MTSPSRLSVLSLLQAFRWWGAGEKLVGRFPITHRAPIQIEKIGTSRTIGYNTIVIKKFFMDSVFETIDPAQLIEPNRTLIVRLTSMGFVIEHVRWVALTYAVQHSMVFLFLCLSLKLFIAAK